MKNSKTVKFIIPVICASILFTLLGVVYGRKQALNTSAGQTAATGETVTVTADTAAVSTTEETTEDTTSESESDQTSDIFSARDLSGEYDDEVITVTLTGSGATADSDKVKVSGSQVVISGSGTYVLSGSLQNGSIVVDATSEDKVQLVLKGVTINSDTYAAVYVKQADKVFITSEEGSENTLSNGGSFTQQDDNNVDAVIFSKDDLTLNGSGKLTVTSPAGHAVVSKDELTITGGVYVITSQKCALRANDSIAVSGGSFTLTAGTDGLHAENNDDDTLGNIYITGGTFTVKAEDDAIHANALLQIDGGSFNITAAEGLEATYVKINDGEISLSASDDGVNAANKSSAYTPTVEINGGNLTIAMGAGDTDGVDSNGNLIITGGTVDITGQSAFDCDGTISFTGGTVTVNGQQVTTIQNQMMGGGMPGGMPGGMQGGRGPGG